MLQHLYSHSPWTLCCIACLFKAASRKAQPAVIGQLSQTWAGLSLCLSARGRRIDPNINSIDTKVSVGIGSVLVRLIFLL